VPDFSARHVRIPVAKSALDKDLRKVVRIEDATQALARSLATPGLLLVFLIGAVTLTSLSISGGPLAYFVIVASVIAAYMALSIGANDVANNMGPAVGSRARLFQGFMGGDLPRCKSLDRGALWKNPAARAARGDQEEDHPPLDDRIGDRTGLPHRRNMRGARGQAIDPSAKPICDVQLGLLQSGERVRIR
jgi:hypothetical protein